ncbi:MAG: hypothetical protein EOO77_03430 [Oxalobacteraceae bacterium]|nr:MAG: hypothetical protein EOO77_03430 [Oxalobacteraceae bacterium]
MSPQEAKTARAAVKVTSELRPASIIHRLILASFRAAARSRSVRRYAVFADSVTVISLVREQDIGLVAGMSSSAVMAR